MANIALNVNVFEGNIDDIKSFYNSINKYTGDQHSKWIGEVAKAFGIDPDDYDTRGSFIDIRLSEEDNAVIIDTESKWFNNYEYWEAILKASNLPLKYHWYCEEPGCEVFCRTVGSEKFFPANYYVDYFVGDDYHTLYLETEEEVVETMSKRLNQNFASIQAIKDYAEQFDDVDNYVTIMEISEIN